MGLIPLVTAQHSKKKNCAGEAEGKQIPEKIQIRKLHHTFDLRAQVNH